MGPETLVVVPGEEGPVWVVLAEEGKIWVVGTVSVCVVTGEEGCVVEVRSLRVPDDDWLMLVLGVETGTTRVVPGEEGPVWEVEPVTDRVVPGEEGPV